MSWSALNGRLRLALEWLKLVKLHPRFRFRRHHRPPAPRQSPGSQTHRKTIFAEVVGVRTFFLFVGSLVAERADLVEAECSDSKQINQETWCVQTRVMFPRKIARRFASRVICIVLYCGNIIAILFGLYITSIFVFKVKVRTRLLATSCPVALDIGQSLAIGRTAPTVPSERTSRSGQRRSSLSRSIHERQMYLYLKRLFVYEQVCVRMLFIHSTF